MEQIRIKIRKLLSLANNNDNEHQAAAALKKAHDLMLEHGITEIGEDAETIDIIKGDWFDGYTATWHKYIASGVAKLYDAGTVRTEDNRYRRFIGMPYQVDACEETFKIICEQIERWYKVALSAFGGQLTKAQRAELRASFKEAAALRVLERVMEILNTREKSSQALVVIDRRVEEAMAAIETKPLPALRTGFGTIAGYNVGNMVQIQKEVKS